MSTVLVREPRKILLLLGVGIAEHFFLVILFLMLKSSGREGHVVLEVLSYTWCINLRP